MVALSVTPVRLVCELLELVEPLELLPQPAIASAAAAASAVSDVKRSLFIGPTSMGVGQ